MVQKERAFGWPKIRPRLWSSGKGLVSDGGGERMALGKSPGKAGPLYCRSVTARQLNVAHERELRSIFPTTPRTLFYFEPPPSCYRHFQAAHCSHLHILICCLAFSLPEPAAQMTFGLTLFTLHPSRCLSDRTTTYIHRPGIRRALLGCDTSCRSG